MCVLPLDLAILGHLLSDGRIAFKELAKATGSDQRTVASRFQRLLKAGVIKSTTIEVDWSKVGLTATASSEVERRQERTHERSCSNSSEKNPESSKPTRP